MNTRITNSGILAVALLGCQNPEYTEPDETNTGNAPRPATTVYEFKSEAAPTYLGADLEQANAVTAHFVNTEAGIVIMPVNGMTESGGHEANLLAGDGFGTYANADYRLPVDWTTAGAFKSIVTAEVTFTSPGDSVLLCRSFATTCVELIHNYLPGISLAIVRLAANAPDTEIGVIGAGSDPNTTVSAAIRGTGPNGLTIALTDEDVVGLPFLATAGTPFTAAWSVERGALEGSIDWSLSINGTEVGSGNNLASMSTSIAKTGGVAMIFDNPLNHGGEPFAVDYEYEFDGANARDFEEPLGFDVDLSPQFGMEFAPLYVYPTLDDDHQYANQTGIEGTPHAVQWNDGLLGAVTQQEGSDAQHFVYSTAFNGDDFLGTPLAGFVDQDTAGGGFYPSPSFCYSQILPLVEAKVRAGVRQEIHRKMFAGIGVGIAAIEPSLPTIAGALTLTYTDLTAAQVVAVATDFADSNVDTAIATSASATYAVTLNQGVSTTFRTEFGAIVTALGAEPTPGNFVYENFGMDADDYAGLVRLKTGLSVGTGVMDGVHTGTVALIDEWPPFNFGDCLGYECNVQWILRDIVTGDNETGQNEDGEDVPALAAACLWGLPPSPAVDAQAAVLTDNDTDDDHPAYPAIPAAPATPPVRETAAASMNTLVLGIYSNFYTAVFGPGVPASNFSLMMTSGDPEATGPVLSSLTITTE